MKRIFIAVAASALALTGAAAATAGTPGQQVALSAVSSSSTVLVTGSLNDPCTYMTGHGVDTVSDGTSTFTVTQPAGCSSSFKNGGWTINWAVSIQPNYTIPASANPGDVLTVSQSLTLYGPYAPDTTVAASETVNVDDPAAVPPPSAPPSDTSAAQISALQAQVAALQAQISALQDQIAAAIAIINQHPDTDPGILAVLIAAG